MENMAGKIIAGLILAALAFALSYQFTSSGGAAVGRFKSYFTCLCVTYALAVALAETFGASISAGEQVYEYSREVAARDIPEWSWKKKNDFTHFVFWISIVPALIGVYCARRLPASED